MELLVPTCIKVLPAQVIKKKRPLHNTLFYQRLVARLASSGTSQGGEVTRLSTWDIAYDRDLLNLHF